MRSLDRLLCEHAAAGRASFQVPVTPAPIKSTDRFVNISALQKSIRRGDADGAMRYAQQGCQLDSEQVFRRLAVCAVEDVGVGNLLAVGMALAVMGSSAMRKYGAPDGLAAYLAYLLAISPKSRLVCDLLSICDYDRSLDGLKVELARTSPAELQRRVSDGSVGIAKRMAAAWILAGTGRFRGANMPKVDRPRTDLMRMMATMHMPLILYYIADRAAARTSDAMFMSLYFVSEMIACEPDLVVSETELNSTVMIAGFPAAAFDLHTHQGRSALSEFGRKCHPVADILRKVSPGRRDTAVRHAVFIVEGGQLAERVGWPAADEIEGSAHSAELAYAGLASSEIRAYFLATIRDNIDQLHELRKVAALPSGEI